MSSAWENDFSRTVSVYNSYPVTASKILSFKTVTLTYGYPGVPSNVKFHYAIQVADLVAAGRRPGRAITS